MADASRFPGLALPFSIVGAAGGWLAAGFIERINGRSVFFPQVFLPAVLASLLVGASGALIARSCVGQRYDGTDLAPPELEARPPGERWLYHLGLVLGAGTLTGLCIGTLLYGQAIASSAVAGYACTVPFLPACAAVVAAARRAERARFGSIVAASDRRAVWGILATVLAGATLLALPDWQMQPGGLRPHWPLQRGDLNDGPWAAMAVLVLTTVCILVFLAADLLALRRARRAVQAGLTPCDAAPVEDDDVARVDLGLGSDVLARVARAGSPYRGRDRALAIVEGDPGRALAALRRASWRGAFGVAVVTLVALAHAGANTATAGALYQRWQCDRGQRSACGEAARLARASMLAPSILGAPSPAETVLLHGLACADHDGDSCLELARLYRGNDGVEPDLLLVSYYEQRAAHHGCCPPGTTLVSDRELICVAPTDPRAPRPAEDLR